MSMTRYGDMNTQLACEVMVEFLERGSLKGVFEQFSQMVSVQRNNTTTLVAKRYNSLETDPEALLLTEGITPDARPFDVEDVSMQLSQYGDVARVTDVVLETHEDNQNDKFVKEAAKLQGEQAMEMLERVKFNVLRAGLNVVYAGGPAVNSRDNVASGVAINDFRLMARSLAAQRASHVTEILTTGSETDRVGVEAAYWGVCHTDLRADFRGLNTDANRHNFIPTVRYGNIQIAVGEFGTVEEFRLCGSQIASPWTDAGGDPTGLLSLTGVEADVYPIIIFGSNAWVATTLKGYDAVVPSLVDNKPKGGDVLGQRMEMGWKTWAGCMILNQAWLMRYEVAASDLAS